MVYNLEFQMTPTPGAHSPNRIGSHVRCLRDLTEVRRQLVGRNLGTKERPTTEPDNGWVKFSGRVGRVAGRFVLSLVWVCDVSNADGWLLGTAVLMGSVVLAYNRRLYTRFGFF